VALGEALDGAVGLLVRRKYFHAPHVFVLPGEAAWEQNLASYSPTPDPAGSLRWEVCADIF
jgi:hypothetical protein